jgi:hypothetical protein
VRDSSFDKSQSHFQNNFYIKQMNDFNYEPYYVLVDDEKKIWKTISVQNFLFILKIFVLYIYREKIIFSVLFACSFTISGQRKLD